MSSAADPDLAALCWPPSSLGEALEELARRLEPRGTGAPLASHAPADLGEQARWISWAAGRLGVEAEPLEMAASELDTLLPGAGPALLRIGPEGGPAGFLLLLGARGDTLRLLGPDHAVQERAASVLAAALRAPHEARHRPEIDTLLGTAGVPAARQAAARTALLRDRLAAQPVADGWLLRPGAARGLRESLVRAGLRRRVLPIVLVFALLYGLEVLAWTLVGESTLHGRIDAGWLAAWVLLVMSLVPLHWLAGWLDARLAIDAGCVLKARLLAGALRSDPERVRRQGAGELLGRVLESQALEMLAFNGGFGVLVALLELGFAGTILLAGAGGALHAAMLAAWVAATLALGGRYLRRLRAWSLERLRMTQDLVERMVGHRTRLAQERPARRDHDEDRELGAYLDASQRMDRAILPVAGAMPRGWMLVSLAAIAPAFVAGSAAPVDVAVALGGMLLAGRALTAVSGGLAALARAAAAWRQVAPLLAGSEEATPVFVPQQEQDGSSAAGTLLVDARQLGFRHAAAAQAVLQGVDLAIARGERILLEGASGSGKSTLAALLAGLRRPASGSLMLAGLDRQTLGAHWHRLATAAPQFHENHIFTGTLAFNLLMGGEWPASEEDLEEARTLCHELGLGELLERMPAGLSQMVGETGWQLSHGERSRIFLARALLAKARLTVLDESFAALDPRTLADCLACALRRADTLVVIAHP